MSRHLSPDEFIDLLDGRLAERDLPHLQQCDTCRRQLGEVRATWESTVHVDVPEPSPLFWEYLSARVRDAVAAEPAPVTRWWAPWTSWRLGSVAAAAIAATALIVTVGLRPDGAPLAPPASAVVQTAAAPMTTDTRFVIENDEPLSMMADLASELDEDATSELGLPARGSAERALADMTDDERAELQRLLSEALNSGA